MKWKLAGKAQPGTSLVDREVFWTVIAGRRLLVDFTCGETQEEHLWNLILRRSECSSCCTSPEIAASIQARLLTTAQVRKDAPSLIDVNGLGRPKESSGKDEDFQQWSKKTEAFFAGLIKLSERILEWAAEQTTEISTEFIEREFLPTATNQERGVQNLEFILHQMHTMLMDLTSCEANDIVANSRKNPLEAWRRLQKTHDPTTGGRKRNLLRSLVSPGRCSLLELQAGIERWESVVSQYEKMLENKVNDEIKLAGLEALVPEELEKHLILNSNRLRTFEDARREVVTCVDALFGLNISDSKPSDTGFREHSDVGAVSSLSLFSRRKRVIQSAQWVF